MLRNTLIYSDISNPLRIKQYGRRKQNLCQRQSHLSGVTIHFLRKGKCLLHHACPPKVKTWSNTFEKVPSLVSEISHTLEPESGQGIHHSGYQQLHQQYLP